VSAVIDVDYSPTGREFVAGSYDRSVRIFPFNGGHSREVYHTKRMQRVFSVRFSGDGSYVFSGSDDMNVRVWKAEASAQLGVTLPREKHKQAYQKALVERYKHLPEIKKVVRHRNVPKPIYKVGPRAWGGSVGLGLGACGLAVGRHRCQGSGLRGLFADLQARLAQPATLGPKASAQTDPHAPPPKTRQAAKMRRAVQDADKRKLNNRIKHSAPGSVTVKPERKKKIVAEVE
jgi:WD repeat and SOF domain-containing protein 1